MNQIMNYYQHVKPYVCDKYFTLIVMNSFVQNENMRE